jgi:hypothetical protein
MSYFCVNATLTNLFWMHCAYNQTLNTCGPCLMCSKYQRGDIAPRYPVPSIHVGAYVLASGITDTGALVIWFADHEVIAR